MERHKFLKYLAQGHGRCYNEVKSSPGSYRRDIMRLCTEDTSYDMQCEGSRALYAYDLVKLYDDIAPFAKKTVRAFEKAEKDDDSHDWRHLCDMTALFAFDAKDRRAEKALMKKYDELYGDMMTRRYSAMIHRVAGNYEYLCTNLLNTERWDYAERIAHDLGAYFIKRRRIEDEDLRWKFLWLWHHMNDVFGSDETKKYFAPLCESSKEVRRFIRVMSAEDKHKPDKSERPAPPDAETAVRMLTDGTVKTMFDALRNGFMRIEPQEAEKLAEYVINEPDEHKKAIILGPFRSGHIRWPKAADCLIGYAGSDNEELRLSAVNALIYAKDQSAAEYAKEMLSKDPDEYRDEYLRILINHCSESDMDLITKLLDSTLTDDRYEAGWHGITLDILKADDGLPDGMYRWIYENSLCSCCRRNAAEVLISHGAFPDECLNECLHDCNTDIRELAEQELDKR